MTDDKVVNIFEKRAGTPVTEKTLEGPAKCICCRHEWMAEAPVGVVVLECPGCQRTSSGRFVNPVQYVDTYHWQCTCGNDLFCITPNFTYCPRCGKKHSGFNEESPF